MIKRFREWLRARRVRVLSTVLEIVAVVLLSTGVALIWGWHWALFPLAAYVGLLSFVIGRSE